MIKKNKNKGFTIVELLVAVAIMLAIATLSISTMNAIGTSRMRANAEIIKSTIEVASDYSKTHGGNTFVSVIKNYNGLQIVETSTAARKDDGTRVDKNIGETNIDDKSLVVYYYLLGDNTKYQLGVNDANEVSNGTLQFQFSDVTGEFVGSYYVESMILANSNKEIKLLFDIKGGTIMFDYEKGADKIQNPTPSANSKTVSMPTFVYGGKAYHTLYVEYDSAKIQQPELAYDSRYVSISGIYRAKDINENPGYKVVFSLKNPHNTMWEDGQVYDYVLTWYITDDASKVPFGG